MNIPGSDNLPGSQEFLGIIGDRVPGWDFGKPAPSSAAKSPSFSGVFAKCYWELCLCCRDYPRECPGKAEVRTVLPHTV